MRMNTSFMTPDAPYKVDVVREKKREEFFSRSSIHPVLLTHNIYVGLHNNDVIKVLTLGHSV